MNGRLARTQALQHVEKQFHEAEIAWQKANATYAGAAFAKTFRDFPWLQSIEMQLEPSNEYDDDGHNGRVISMYFIDAEGVGEIDIRFEQDGQLDVCAFVDYLSGEWEGEHEAEDLYVCFNPYDWSYDDIRVKASRADIADLLAQETISGYEAFIRLFPEYQGNAWLP